MMHCSHVDPIDHSLLQTLTLGCHWAFLCRLFHPRLHGFSKSKKGEIFKNSKWRSSWNLHTYLAHWSYRIVQYRKSSHRRRYNALEIEWAELRSRQPNFDWGMPSSMFHFDVDRTSPAEIHRLVWGFQGVLQLNQKKTSLFFNLERLNIKFLSRKKDSYLPNSFFAPRNERA